MKLEKDYKVQRALFISIKPEFVEKIFNGTKTIELRKSVPNVKKNDLIIIYSTGPVMSVIGTCRVNNIISLKPTKLWDEYYGKMGIDKKRYFEYYKGKDVAVGIFLKDAKKMEKAIPLSELRVKFKNFHPPQTFRYFDVTSFNQLIAIQDV
ncbi:ASCH domain-containing protein [Flavobacterium pedocola]